MQAPAMVRFVCSALLLFALSIRADGADKSFTLGANVVIMAGLPGDVESEHRFEEQAKQLLESLALKEALPKSIHVLIDDPKSITLPAGTAGDIKAATRDNFLALAENFGGRRRSARGFRMGPCMRLQENTGVSCARPENHAG